MRAHCQRGLEFAYDCEQHLVKELPSVIEAAQFGELKAALEQHLDQTRMQTERLKRVFSGLKRAAATETNHVILSILSENKKLTDHIEQSPLRDAALITSLNQVEHYEIALYGSLCALARVLRLDDAATLLEQTLAEEKAADQKLTDIAVNSVNPRAVGSINHPHDFVVI